MAFNLRLHLFVRAKLNDIWWMKSCRELRRNSVTPALVAENISTIHSIRICTTKKKAKQGWCSSWLTLWSRSHVHCANRLQKKPHPCSWFERVSPKPEFKGGGKGAKINLTPIKWAAMSVGKWRCLNQITVRITWGNGKGTAIPEASSWNTFLTIVCITKHQKSIGS